MQQVEVRYGEAGDESELAALFTREYGGDEDWALTLRKLAADPVYHPHRWAIAQLDGKIVSAGFLMPRRVRIGEAVLKAGLVGYVATVTEHRRKGYGSRVMHALQDLLEDEEFDYGYLSASPVGLLLYSYLGWQIFLDDVFVELPLEHVATLAPRDRAYEVVPLREVSVRELWELYDSYARCTPGAIVRTPQEFAWLIDFKLYRGHIHPQLSLAAVSDNKVCAYLVGRPGDFHVPHEGLYTVTEAAHHPAEPDAYGAMLPVLCDKMTQMGFKTLRLGLHSEHPLMVWATRKRARRVYDPLHDMALITNLERFVFSMGVELHNRLSNSRWRGQKTSLQIATEERSVTISLQDNLPRRLPPGRQPEHSINVSEQDVVPWLLGHISIKALAQIGAVRASSQAALDLADVLFPRIELWQSHLDC